jgi:hypothetical protein
MGGDEMFGLGVAEDVNGGGGVYAETKAPILYVLRDAYT